ncbi:hypothetical protein Tco_0592485 [Tanacetum coccineum]
MRIEAVRASEKEAVKRLEATQKEIDELKAATEAALKRAHMAESAQKAVEGELKMSAPVLTVDFVFLGLWL